MYLCKATLKITALNRKRWRSSAPRAADGALCALLLRYFNNYCLCMSGTAPVEELAAFLQARGAQYLSGKEADVAALAARMPGWKLRGTNLARMDRLAGGAALPEGFSLRMLGAAGCAGSDRAGSTDR